MRVLEIIVDIPLDDIESASGFYRDFLGLSVEEFSLGWVARFTSPETQAKVQLVTRDATAPVNPLVSLKVDDVHAACDDAISQGLDIVHPLSTESWGITRFFLRAPDGTVLNIAQHVEDSPGTDG